MPETAIVVLSLVIIAFVVVLFRMTAALVSMSGAKARSGDRERRDQNQLIERLVEKREAPSALDVAKIHAQERVQHTRVDAMVEQAATEKPKPETPEGDPYCTVEEYEASDNA